MPKLEFADLNYSKNEIGWAHNTMRNDNPADKSGLLMCSPKSLLDITRDQINDSQITTLRITKKLLSSPILKIGSEGSDS
jgi:hypothetical protein